MGNIIIKPSKLYGNVKVPSSKSLGHRALICGSLGNGVSNIHNVSFSEDIEATCHGMEAFGAEISKLENSIKIKGIWGEKQAEASINCKESGSTLRFLVPLAAAIGIPATFYGEGKLIERPLKPYYEIFENEGIEYCSEKGRLPLHINGKLEGGNFFMEGGISSQFISGLLFALPLLSEDSRIIMTSKLQSKPYVDLTIDALGHFGIFIVNDDYKEFFVRGNQKYKSKDYTVEGDFSQSAFWLAAGTLGGEVCCSGLNNRSSQGDKVIIDIIERMNGKIIINEDVLKATPRETLGTIIDASDCPDLVPIIAVLGALSKGRTEIVNAGRLRIKESDRLLAIASELKKLGADIEEIEDGLIIEGKDSLEGGIVESWNDHRIAMSLAIAAVRCMEPVVIKDADCVNKSYPDFWRHYKQLGGDVKWI